MTTRTATPAPIRSAGRRRVADLALWAGVPAVAAATLVLGLLLTEPGQRAVTGLRDAGALVAWLVPVARTCWDLATFATLGGLLVAGWLSAASGLSGAARRLLRLTAAWSLAWAVASVGLVLVSIAELVGTGFGAVLSDGSRLHLVWQVPENRSLALVAGVALVVAGSALRVRSTGAVRALLLLAAAALVPVLVNGHAGSTSNHYLAAQSLVVHVLAASLWVGGLAVLVLHLRGDLAALRLVLPRFSTLAGWCFAAVLLSGVAGAWVRLGLSWTSWTSAYGAVVAAKSVTLVALGLFGLAHRRLTLPQVAAGRRGAFARFAVVEVLVMSVATALAVVLGRTPAPASALSQATPPHATTFATVEGGLEPVGVRTLLLSASPDTLLLTAIVVALVAYLVAVLRLRRSGGSWPVRRTVAMASGLLVLAWATSGGLGSYGSALFSTHVAQLLVVSLVVPVLLTLGTPLALMEARHPDARAALDRAGGRVDPVNGLVLLVLVLAGALMTPLLDASMRSTAGHLAVLAAGLAAGWLFFWPLLGVDRLPPGRRDGADAGLLIAVLALLLGVYAAHIYSSPGLFAGQWFTELDLWWVDLVADQRSAGLVVIGFAVATLLVAPLARAGSRPRRPERGAADRSEQQEQASVQASGQASGQSAPEHTGASRVLPVAAAGTRR